MISIRNVMERVGAMIKSDQYKIDADISTTALIGIVYRRITSLLRGCFKRIILPLNVHKAIFIAPRVELRNCRHIYFGKYVTLGKGVTIDGLSSSGIVIEDLVNIGPYTIIEATGIINSIGKGVRIGNNSGIGAFSFIGGAGGVVIGSDVIMGQYVSIHSENHVSDKEDIPIRHQGVTRKGIVIENNCWIGAKVTILDGSHIEEGSVIAAGSVVRGLVPKNSVVGGVPAKLIKTRISST